MKKVLLLSAFMAVAVIFHGCAGIREEVRVEPAPRVLKISPGVLDTAVKDIRFLMDEGKLDEQETLRASELISAIEAFRHMRPEGPELSAGLERLLESASGLVHERLSRERPPEEYGPAPDEAIADLHRRLLSACRSGDSRTVIEIASLIREIHGTDGLSPGMAAALALSLEAEGRREEALREGIDALRRLEQLPDVMLLAADLARWNAERGNTREAVSFREKLASLLSERSFMLAGLEKQLEPKAAAEKDFKSWVESLRTGRADPGGVLDLLEMAAEMANEERFSDARDLLARTRQWIEPAGRETDLIDEAMRRLEAAEEQYIQKRIGMLSRRDVNLGPVSDLIARERYREALARLDVVERVSGPAPEIDEIRKAAMERLITRETTRAAEAFLAAGKTGDPAQKKALLEETRSILAGLLSAYPDSASAGRIRSYLDRVERELKSL